MELAQQNAVTESVLHKFAPLIEQHLGLPVDLRIIPYARDTTEQVAIISSIANATLPKQTVILDVTHGFRHLPMLGLVAAHYLERVRQVNVRNLYYGALEMTEHGETPVLDLRGLLQTMDWIQAFAAYDASGNYAHFAPLLANENWSEADCKTLNEAAFFERTTNIVKTREKLSSLKTALGERNSTFLRLFGDELQKRLSWWKLPNRADWESQLGNAYFEKADYLRASIFIQEACLSKAMPVEEQHEYNERRETLRKTMQKTDGRFARLTDLRNGMAHGVKGFRQASSKVLKNESTLRATLGDFVKNWQTLGKTPQ
jgi:CRISPR-associated DxTHG motif protein